MARSCQRTGRDPADAMVLGVCDGVTPTGLPPKKILGFWLRTWYWVRMGIIRDMLFWIGCLLVHISGRGYVIEYCLEEDDSWRM